MAEAYPDKEFGVLENRQPTDVHIWIGNVKGEGLRVHSGEFSRDSGWDEASVALAWMAFMRALAHQRQQSRVYVNGTHAIPQLDLPLRFETNPELTDIDDTNEAQNADSLGMHFVEQLLGRLVCGPGKLLRDYLRKYRYIGPIREVPSRSNQLKHIDWANGLAAWKILADSKDQGLANEVSDWLFHSRRFDTGYRLKVERYFEVSEALLLMFVREEYIMDDPTAKEILEEINRGTHRDQIYLMDVEKDTRVHPQALGVGISEIIPVIVALLADGAEICQVEQPCLHLHPRQQAVLGDLLIESVKRKNKALIIETHSEHLILRLLRRIRELHDNELPETIPQIHCDDLAVYYVQPNAGQIRVTPLRIDETGEFLDHWPDGFFEERAEELF